MPATQHSVSMYGLSTCIHCRHTREFLEARGVPFTCTYVDLLEGEERSEALRLVRSVNPRVSFPTLLIDGGAKVLVGFREEELAGELGL